jgi:hypothetical protein
LKKKEKKHLKHNITYSITYLYYYQMCISLKDFYFDKKIKKVIIKK